MPATIQVAPARQFALEVQAAIPPINASRFPQNREKFFTAESALATSMRELMHLAEKENQSVVPAELKDVAQAAIFLDAARATYVALVRANVGNELILSALTGIMVPASFALHRALEQFIEAAGKLEG